MRIVFILFCFISSVAFTQTRKQKPLVYKTIESTAFEAGDRIQIGTVSTEKVEGKYQKYTVTIPESFDAYRDFMFAHPEMEYRIVVIWQQLGRKFPSLTETVGDSLIQYFRKPAGSPDNRLYVNAVYNAFSRKVEGMQIDMEILSVNTSSILAKKSGVPPIILPENHVLYRSYKNELVVETAAIPAEEAIWIADDQLKIKYPGRGRITAQLSRNRDETLIHLYSGTKDSRQSHGVYIYDVQKLPEPDVFLESESIKSLAADDLTKEGAVFTASYPQGMLPNAAFKVAEVRFEIAGKKIAMTGNKLSVKVVKAINAAPAGSEIVIKKVVVNGSRRVKYYDVLKLVK